MELKKKMSLIICTRNRPRALTNCLFLFSSFYKDFFRENEVIVVDQSENDNTGKVVKKIDLPIRYFKQNKTGVSKAKNLGIARSRGNIIVFTDDDCLVTKDWLYTIEQSFLAHKQVVGVFGQVFPFKPQKHDGRFCPCTFTKKKMRLITKPVRHWREIGFGNNMAFRREVFSHIGVFREWLGPGSVGKSAEDAEFALRALLNNYKLLYNPKVKIYHNRWLTKEESRKQSLTYTCGEVACYGYVGFNRFDLGREVVKENFLDSYNKIISESKSLIMCRRGDFQKIIDILIELVFRLRGILVAFWFFKKEPLDLPVSRKDR